MLKRALGAILVAALLLLVHQVSLMNSNEEPAPAQGASEVRRGTSQMKPTAGIEIPPDLRGDSSETTAASLELGSTGVVVSSGSTAGAPPPPPPPPPPEPTGPTEVSLLDGCEIEESGSGEGSLLVVSNLYSCDVCARPVHPPGCLCADVYDPKSRRILRQNLTLNTLNNRNGNKLETKLAFPARSPWRFTRDSGLPDARKGLLQHALQSRRLSTTILYLLGVSYRNRPLLTHFNESDADSGGGGGGGGTTLQWETGAQILASVWPIVQLLRSLKLPEAAGAGGMADGGGENGMIITYGTQKGRDFTHIYLAAVIGNYDLLPLLSYMDPYSIARLLKERRVSNAVLFLPAPLVASFKRIVPATVRVIGLRAPDGAKQMQASPHGAKPDGLQNNREDLVDLIGNLLEGDRQPPVAGQTDSALTDDHLVQDVLADSLLGVSARVPSSAAVLVPRSNSRGGTEIVVTPLQTNFERSVRALEGSVAGGASGIQPTRGHANISPMSSGDMLGLLEGVVVGDRCLMVCSSLGHLPYASDLASAQFLVGTPVQYRSVVEPFLLQASLTTRYTADKWWGGAFGPRLRICGSGGGAPEPAQQKWFADTVCRLPAVVMEAWGSYEMLDITYTMNKKTHFQPGVKAWALADVGPYKRSEGRGELLLRTAHMHQHADREFNARQFVMVEGRESEGEFFRTKDIVSMMTGPNTYGRLDAGVKMIDKVNGPFSVAGGKLVATGLVERAIEGEQDLIYNAVVFGSERVKGIVAVVWPTSSRAEDRDPSRLLEKIRERLSSSGYQKRMEWYSGTQAVRPWEIPTTVVVSDEPWEYRPRHKIRWMLMKKFQAAVNAALPGAIWPPIFQPGTVAASTAPVDPAWPPSAIDGLYLLARTPSSKAATAYYKDNFQGEFSDTNHPGGRRMIAFDSSKDAPTILHSPFSIWGHDGDPGAIWEGSGYLGPDRLIVVDLSSKGGPAKLVGEWTGTGIRWVADGAEPIANDGTDGWPKLAAGLAAYSLVSHGDGPDATIFGRVSSVNLGVIKNIYLANQLRAVVDRGRGLHCSFECKEYLEEFSLLCKMHDSGEHGAPRNGSLESIDQFGCSTSPGRHNERTPRADVAELFVLDALMACDDVGPSRQMALAPDGAGPVVVHPANIRTGCMLRDTNGMLRDPIARPSTYDTKAAPSGRRDRFDPIPWQLWDLPRTVEFRGQQYALARVDLIVAIIQLYGLKEEMAAAVPLYLPSLGLLHEWGSRFRDRLTYAYRIATRAPQLLVQQNDTAVIAAAVYRVCYPWGKGGAVNIYGRS